MLRAAFRELHGARLHGFALLVTLGDRPLASRLTAEALAAGSAHARELRHPERASAWLRARVLRGVKRARRSGSTGEERRAVLTTLGVDGATFDIIAGFTPVERAALVAGVIERLDPRDVELVLGTSAKAIHRQTTAVRRLFLERRAATSTSEALAAPVLANRVAEIAARALSRRPA